MQPSELTLSALDPRGQQSSQMGTFLAGAAVELAKDKALPMYGPDGLSG